MDQHLLKKTARRQKYATTFGVYFGNICLACGMNAYAPAIVDFRNKYEEDVDRVAILFTILTITFMLGALLTSFIYNFMNRQLGVIIYLTGMGAALYLTPHAPSLTVLYVIAAFLGLFNGIYNASQTVWVIEMWEGEAGPYIQGAHFSYAIGSLIPSLLLAPFLTKETEDEDEGGTTAAPEKNDRMWIPFTVVGGLATIAAIIQCYLFTFQRYVPPKPLGVSKGYVENKNNNAMPEDHKSSKKSNSKYFKIFLIFLSAIFLGFYQGMEMVSMQFLSIFAQFGELNFSAAEGAQVLTAGAGSYAVGRGIGIFATLKIKPQFILGVNLILLFIATTILLIFGNSTVGLWSGVCLLGFGFSTINPSFCAYIQEYLKFTNVIGSVMLVSGSAIGAIFPIVIGEQIEENTKILTYVNLFSTSVITVAIIIILTVTRGRNSTISNKV